MWGDRENVAEFVVRHEDRIRAIARRKLPRGARTVFGSEDVFATVARRVDALAASGTLRAQSEAQLWSLIQRVVENVSLERARLIESTAARSGDDAEFWAAVSSDLRRCRDDNEAFVLVFEMMSVLTDQSERQIFLLRLRGVSHKVIAQQLGTTDEVVRQRWLKIRRELRGRFGTQSQTLGYP